MNQNKLLIVSLLIFIISGCATLSEMQEMPDEVKRELKNITRDKSTLNISNGRSDEQIKLRLPSVDANRLSFNKSVLDRRFTLVVKDVPVKSIMYSLAKDIGVQLDLHPIPDKRVTLMLRDVPLRLILDKIADQLGLDYKLESGVLTVKQDVPRWVTYHIDYVNIKKQSEEKISLNMSVGSSAVGQGAGGTTATASTLTGDNSTSIVIQSDQDFWKEIEEGLKSILGESNRPNLVINKESGTVSVFSPSRLQTTVKNYIDTILNRAKKQVLIEVTVVEVELSHNFQSGIDWSRLRLSNSATGQLPTDFNIQIFSDPNRNNVAQSFNFDLGIKLLDQFGKTRVLSTPKIMAVNNQTAILKVVDNEVYFTISVDTNVNQSATTTTYETEVHTVPVGFMMTLTPFVGDNGDVTLHIRPTLSRIVGYVDDPNPALRQVGAVSKVPVIQEREMSSILRLKDRQVAIIGGLMQHEGFKDKSGFPGLATLNGIGNFFSYNQKKGRKTELVIFIRPVIISNPSYKKSILEFNRYRNLLQN
ncbi:MAG TPA: pilus (MSHA type) biogenesis protein MshL [Sulfurovum sp.]|nr:pilus (MSHA type) biogenesis protein MshL [Sulfurovum sp.]